MDKHKCLSQKPKEVGEERTRERGETGARKREGRRGRGARQGDKGRSGNMYKCEPGSHFHFQLYQENSNQISRTKGY